MSSLASLPDNAPRKLYYLTCEAPRDGQASYTHIHEIINGLKRRGWDISLYQPSYTSKEKSPGLILRMLHAIALQFRFWFEFRPGAVIYIRAHYLAFPTTLIAWALRVPVVQEINGPFEDPFVTYPELRNVKGLLIWSMRLQYRLSDRHIIVTENLAGWLHGEVPGANPVIVPNGANTERFKPGLKKPPETPAKYAIFFGGLSRWHGIAAILQALQSPQWPSDTELVIIGDGPERSTIERAAATDKRIHYLGKKDYRALPDYVANALCGLVPITNPNGRSDTGLYPLKLFEMLACGIPVIVTDFPGQADLVRSGDCGVVIKPDNGEQIAKAVADFARDETSAKEAGARGAALVHEHHSWDQRAAQTHELLIGIKSA